MPANISKPKLALLVGLPTGLIIGSVLAIAAMEGAFIDPAGQQNNPVTLECHSGILANRDVSITDDGEYNWMFITGQVVNMNLTLVQTNHTLNLYFESFSTNMIVRQTTLNVGHPSTQWSITIPDGGHWRLEMVNGDYEGHQYFVSVYVNANPISHSLGLIDCLNPGDLFRNG